MINEKSLEFRQIYTQRAIEQRDLKSVKENCYNHFLGMLSDTFEKIEKKELGNGTTIKVIIEVKPKYDENNK
jgi:hypothetical protein